MGFEMSIWSIAINQHTNAYSKSDKPVWHYIYFITSHSTRCLFICHTEQYSYGDMAIHVVKHTRRCVAQSPYHPMPLSTNFGTEHTFWHVDFRWWSDLWISVDRFVWEDRPQNTVSAFFFTDYESCCKLSKHIVYHKNQ